jgi:hypothetical protein
MFQKSIVQEDMFKPASWVMEGRTRKIYEDRQGWYNQFRLQVTNKINQPRHRALNLTHNSMIDYLSFRKNLTAKSTSNREPSVRWFADTKDTDRSTRERVTS